MKMIASFSVAAAVVAASAALLSSSPVQAKGCGGYVNVAVWGCAPWDNNGPKAGVTPGYKAPAPVAVRVPTPPPSVISQNNNRLIGQDGGGLISPGNKNGLVGNAGGTVISPGNVTGGGLVGNAGGTMRR